MARKPSKNRKIVKIERQLYCGHCKEYLSKTIFYPHYEKFYDEENEHWHFKLC